MPLNSYTNKNLVKIAEARNSLLGAFVWSETEEGDEYWNTVYKKLGRIQANIRNIIEIPPLLKL